MQKKITYIIILFLTGILSCITPTEKQLTMLDVFPKQQNTDSTFVFSLDTIKDLNHLESIVCKEVRKNKKTYIRTSSIDISLGFGTLFNCKGLVCGLVNESNVISIETGADKVCILHSDIEMFSIKSYQNLLTKQFLNRGKEFGYASSPNKVLTYIEFIKDFNEYEKQTFNTENLYQKLDTISKAYYNFLTSFKRVNKIDSLKQVYPLNLLIPMPPPPPPPSMDKVPRPVEIVAKPEDNNEPELIEIETNN